MQLFSKHNLKKLFKTFLYVGLFTFVVFASPTKASAADYYHDGMGQLDSASSWWDSSTFSGTNGTLPGPGDVGHVDGVTVTESTSVVVNYNLQIGSGGTLTVANGTTLNVQEGGIIEVSSGSTLNIDSGGILSVNYGISAGGTLIVNGGGNFNVNTGATFSVDSTSGFSQNNGSWTINGSVSLGNPQTIPSGFVWTVSSGGSLTMTAGTLTVDGLGTLNINSGGTLTMNAGSSLVQYNNSWTIDGTVNLGVTATIDNTKAWNLSTTANLNITAGGSLNVDMGGTLADSGSMSLDGTLTVANGGNLTVLTGSALNISSGATFTQNNNSWDIAGNVNIGNTQGIGYTYNWTINDGATVTVQSAGSLSIDGTVTIDTGGSMTVSSGGSLGVNSGTLTNNGTLVNNGTWTKNGGTITTAAGANTTNNKKTSYAVTGTAGSLITPYSIAAQTGNGATNYNAVLSHSPTTWSQTGMPAGLSFNTSTGEITGTPTAAGTGSITITSTDGAISSNAIQVISYNISAAPDTTPPTITSVYSNKAAGTYNVGEVIDIHVLFSEPVTSTGNVTVTLETGVTDRTCTFTISNSNTGACNYTVQAGDTSADLNVNTISGVIKDQSNNDMVNFVPATNLAANAALVIDTTVVSSGGGGGGGGGATGGGSYGGNVTIIHNNATTTQIATTTPTAEGCLSGNKFNTQTGQLCTVIGTPNTGTITQSNDSSLAKELLAAGVPVGFRFNKNYAVKSVANDIVFLQVFLNRSGFTVAKTGYGSRGLEFKRFGPATLAALAKFQKANGISPAVGYFGPVTRAKINSMLGNIGL